MPAQKPVERFQTPDTAVLDEVRQMIGAARYAALASLSPEDGFPLCTRIGLATLEDGTPLTLISALAAHGPALMADPRCSLLIGEVGKGDPLAHKRVMLKCRAKFFGRDSAAHEAAKARYLAAHPKAGLYADLGDFSFVALRAESGLFNAGFGRAFRLDSNDLITSNLP